MASTGARGQYGLRHWSCETLRGEQRDHQTIRDASTTGARPHRWGRACRCPPTVPKHDQRGTGSAAANGESISIDLPRRPTCPVGRPTLSADLPRRPTCPIGQPALLPTCLIGRPGQSADLPRVPTCPVGRPGRSADLPARPTCPVGRPAQSAPIGARPKGHSEMYMGGWVGGVITGNRQCSR